MSKNRESVATHGKAVFYAAIYGDGDNISPLKIVNAHEVLNNIILSNK